MGHILDISWQKMDTLNKPIWIWASFMFSTKEIGDLTWWIIHYSLFYWSAVQIKIIVRYCLRYVQITQHSNYNCLKNESKGDFLNPKTLIWTQIWHGDIKKIGKQIGLEKWSFDTKMCRHKRCKFKKTMCRFNLIGCFQFKWSISITFSLEYQILKCLYYNLNNLVGWKLQFVLYYAFHSNY